MSIMLMANVDLSPQVVYAPAKSKPAKFVYIVRKTGARASKGLSG